VVSGLGLQGYKDAGADSIMSSKLCCQGRNVEVCKARITDRRKGI